jgi:hypothetical protein
MTDEPTLSIPPPSSFALEKQPGINPDLIRECVVEGKIDYLISLFDYQRRAMLRAETLAQVYFTQMEILHRRLDAAKRGELPGLDYSKPRRAPSELKSLGGKTVREAIDESKAVEKKTTLDLAIDL